jgi:hypothetical protein
MASIEPIHLETLTWQPGRRGRIWYIQPRFDVDARVAPFVSVPAPGELTALRLLRIVCVYDQTHFPDPGLAPTLILLPEFALPHTEIPTARELISHARPNTLFVLGLGHMSNDQAQVVEPEAQLWDGPADGRFTNCALIGVGGSDRVFLQPKILPSRWEQDVHWPGAVVRLFAGEYIQFHSCPN